MKSRYAELAPVHASLFGQPWWLEILCNKQWDTLVIEDVTGTILWPYHVKQFGVWKYVTVPHVTLFQGPFVVGKPSNSAWHEAFEFFTQFSSFQYQCAPNWQCPIGLTNFQISITNRTHYELVVSTDWRKGYNKITQRKLKKAHSEFFIREASNLDGFLKLSSLSYATQQVPVPFQKEVMQELFDATQEHGASVVLESYTKDEQLAGCVWLVWDRTYVYYFLSGMDRSIPNNASMVGLVDYAIELALKKKLQFNFYGSEVPGVARFMKGFGATEANSQLFTHQKSSLLSVAKSIKKALKN